MLPPNTKNAIGNPISNETEKKQKNPTAFGAPFSGFMYFCSHPKLWFYPLLFVLIGILLALVAVGSVVYLNWPSYDGTWWQIILDFLLTIGLALGVFLLFWVAVLPIMLGFAFDGLVKQVYKDKGIGALEERTFASVKSAIQVLIRTIGWRILWPILGVVTSFIFAPLGIIISEFGIGHIAAIDAFDLALAMRGISGKQRAKLAHVHNSDIFNAGLSGGILSSGLSFLIITWPLFFPSMFTGMALWIAAWSDDYLNQYRDPDIAKTVAEKSQIAQPPKLYPLINKSASPVYPLPKPRAKELENGTESHSPNSSHHN